MSQRFDDPGTLDNRNYDYRKSPSIERIEYPIITRMIVPGSKVIDLGCGNGSLMEKLLREKNVTSRGIEISASGVEACHAKGLDVKQGRIDQPIPFGDESFDYAVCNVTLQMVEYPEVLMSEMKRIARYQVISFPNFAFIKNRFDLMFRGRMPQPMLFGYEWYSTGHIHQLSIKDFESACRKFRLEIIQSVSIHSERKGIVNLLSKFLPNLFSVENIFLLKKSE